MEDARQIFIFLKEDEVGDIVSGRKKIAMGASPKLSRAKISTTVAPETISYLNTLVERGQAATLAEALDAVVRRLRALEDRRRLELATAAYFDRLSPEAREEEVELESALSGSAKGIDFDREP